MPDDPSRGNLRVTGSKHGSRVGKATTLPQPTNPDPDPHKNRAQLWTASPTHWSGRILLWSIPKPLLFCVKLVIVTKRVLYFKAEFRENLTIWALGAVTQVSFGPHRSWFGYASSFTLLYVGCVAASYYIKALLGFDQHVVCPKLDSVDGSDDVL